MKKIILIPDSFKGTMSSIEVCSVMEQTIHHHCPAAKVVCVPVADGGEGTVDAFLQAVGGEKIPVRVQGPFFEEVEAFYGWLPGDVAVIEMAAAAGLPLVGDCRQVEKATTYGVGEIMQHALLHGCKKIVIGLGGSATNDGGCGAAAALGAVFKNRAGEEFVPTGATLQQIVSIDLSAVKKKLENVECVTMCDIDNPLCGVQGAAAVFGPQKGADAAMVDLLDKGLAHMAAVIKQSTGRDVLALAGAGAAGGMGAGTVAFFGSSLQRGIETVLDTVGFDDLLQDADMVFSGEGKIDSQSLRGKVVLGVAQRTKKAGVPLVCVVGAIGDGMDGAYEQGVTAVFSINRMPMPFKEAAPHSKENLAIAMDNIIRLIK